MTLPETYKTWTDQTGVVHAGEVLGSVGGFNVIECGHCRYKHVTPLPSVDELKSFYTDRFYEEDKHLYIDECMEDKEWLEFTYNSRYEVIEDLLNGRKGRLLDVGSGPGFFLETGLKRGWTVKGIEPSSQASKFSRDTLNVDVLQSFLDAETAKILGAFDLIHMSEVLEHLNNPLELLTIAKSMLSVDGILAISVPNDFNPLQTLLSESMGYEPWWIAPPHHLNYFNIESINKLLESVGFSILEAESSFPIEFFLIMGENYIGDSVKGRAMHSLRKNFDIQLIKGGGSELRLKLYRELAKMGLGREIIVFARKSCD